MKKTFVTTMPDHVGAFLKASRCIAGLGLNITRVSYNKAIDTNTLFLEAEGSEEALQRADQLLREIGYLPTVSTSAVLLVEFRLRDLPGTVTTVLELIRQYDFNITYISAQGDGSGFQDFKMGLFVDDPERFSRFLNAASRLCPVRVIDYDKTEKILDNSIFYVSFASELADRMGLGQDSRMELVIQSNQVMQKLDERNEPFHKTFEYIRLFSESLARYRGDAYCPRVTHFDYGADLAITLIEPPCGGNTCILRHQGMYLFVDTGYACYRQEMLKLFRELIPDFDTCRKAAFITHADLDHCGLLDLFPTAYMSYKTKASLVDERNNQGLRESNPLHAPYIRICKTLTSYRSPDPNTLFVMAGGPEPMREPLTRVGSWRFGGLDFEVYEGAGGHLPGELVLVERSLSLVFTGDILINIKELLPAQTEYNRYAPYLMSSVDTEPAMCAAERKAVSGILGPGTWHIFSGHGPRKEMTI